MKVKLIILGSILPISLGTGGFLYWNYITSPEYSLVQLKSAINEHDNLKFEKYFDTEGVTEKLINQLLSEETTSKNESEKAGQEFGKGLATLLKPQIVNSLKKQINTYIEVGSFGDNKDFSLSNLWNKTGLAYLGEIKSVRKEGQIAEIIFPVNHKRYNQEIDLKIKMRKLDNYWQIADFSNLSEYFKKITELEENKIKQLNENIAIEISNTLKISDCIKTQEKVDQWGYSGLVKINCNISNMSQKNISDFSVDIHLTDTNNKVNQNLNPLENSDKSLPIQNWKNWFWNINTNNFIDAQKDLFETPTENIFFTPDIHWIKFDDGQVLKPYDKFQEIGTNTLMKTKNSSEVSQQNTTNKNKQIQTISSNTLNNSNTSRDSESNKIESFNFLANKKLEKDVISLQSGLLYKIIKEGTGNYPTVSDKVTVNYRGRLVNGKEFDSSYKRNAPATFTISSVIKGWQEGIQKIKEGGKIELYVPAYLAYNDHAPPEIGPGATLIFEIELLKIDSDSIDFSNRIFAGSINGNYKIHMNLTKIGNDVTGSYYYDIYKTKIKMSGKIENNKFVINEFEANGKGYIIGVFSGTYTGDTSLNGTWNKPDKSKSLPFSVTSQ